MEAQKDCLVRAISKDGFVNAVAAYTRGLTERARQTHHTSPVATAALGRALAACSMMGNALKDNGASVTMQIKGDGPLGTILTVSDSEGNVRGYVQNPAVDLALPSRRASPVASGNNTDAVAGAVRASRGQLFGGAAC